MKSETCRQCQNYIQHYGLKDGRIFRLHCGHCVLRPTTRKLPDASPCEHFDTVPEVSRAFVSKEYLTKALLLRVLNMELLPEILESPPYT